MAINALNELIFGPDVYFYGFYQFLKGFCKLADFKLKILGFCGPRGPFLGFVAKKGP